MICFLSHTRIFIYLVPKVIEQYSCKYLRCRTLCKCRIFSHKEVMSGWSFIWRVAHEEIRTSSSFIFWNGFWSIGQRAYSYLCCSQYPGVFKTGSKSCVSEVALVVLHMTFWSINSWTHWWLHAPQIVFMCGAGGCNVVAGDTVLVAVILQCVTAHYILMLT